MKKREREKGFQLPVVKKFLKSLPGSWKNKKTSWPAEFLIALWSPEVLEKYEPCWFTEIMKNLLSSF